MPITSSEATPQPAQQQGADPRLGGGSRAGTRAPENQGGAVPDDLSDAIGRSFGQRQDYKATLGRTVVPIAIVKDLRSDGEMPGTPYRVIVLDLSVVHDHFPIAGTIDMVMQLITLTQLSAGASFRLHVGERDGILFGATGLPMGSALDLETPEQTRLLLTNTVQFAGATAELTIGVGRRIP